MTDNRDFERDIKALEERLTEKIISETAKTKYGLLDLIAARSVVMGALVEELDETQVERVKARAEGMVDNETIKKYVKEWFNPSEDG
ncbi:hypothetical protein F8A10_12010 [Paracoccus kondratievae]|uniref:hypothetical protein n=1 Tax=Paracoccus kondratievae TaxID=135740 RepID=UPI001266605A|nr:hypothetical protein [Paracoccus kondratievae]QFQ88236.1 hypothetical protein F8A10_12010 [Paracoccus kondratievae]